jgi:hypothetical protein
MARNRPAATLAAMQAFRPAGGTIVTPDREAEDRTGGKRFSESVDQSARRAAAAAELC